MYFNLIRIFKSYQQGKAYCTKFVRLTSNKYMYNYIIDMYEKY